ncbi:hypothetical protein HL658_25885 [Azospirillum sp. RWY-5-1]|uniref:Uncharacterized protein n=1 Tax=Azospirillum oleiclasticum TaxID=2735135 RepID=A0ABX2TGQ8_9PROT|nr:hypothetical protein [Azospirillum oleiclasticum]NYZ15984.1 hypothetical protein [Azospirillum oleiclasticum]NYZ23537.1 hypothetical protein [Azospirillum oleiclasticum]
MIRTTPVLVPNPPPLWPSQVAHCLRLMRDLGAPAVLFEGQLIATPFGPRIAATMALSAEMGPVPLDEHPSYRPAMRDASAMVTFARMAALNASGIDPVTASTEPESALWQVVVVPAGVALIARTDNADFGPFLLSEREPDERQSMLVGRQLAFAGITVGEPDPCTTIHE